jgi:hypothetical protein
MATFTDEQKQEIADKYLAAEPTPENSMGIVSDLADEYNHSVNGIRMFLSQKGVYIKKTPATGKTAAAAASGDKPVRVSKEDAHNQLTAAIEAAGKTADSEIISKLTGKAALYFAGVLS